MRSAAATLLLGSLLACSDPPAQVQVKAAPSRAPAAQGSKAPAENPFAADPSGPNPFASTAAKAASPKASGAPANAAASTAPASGAASAAPNASASTAPNASASTAASAAPSPLGSTAATAVASGDELDKARKRIAEIKAENNKQGAEPAHTMVELYRLEQFVADPVHGRDATVEAGAKVMDTCARNILKYVKRYDDIDAAIAKGAKASDFQKEKDDLTARFKSLQGIADQVSLINLAEAKDAEKRNKVKELFGDLQAKVNAIEAGGS